MQVVYSGDIIEFEYNFVDSIGDPYDPAEVVLRIAKNATSYLAGPFSLSGGDIIQTGIGSYVYSYQTTTFSTPGIYNARWEATIDGLDQVYLETFQIAERPPEASGILDAPRLYGVMVESTNYRTLGTGLTDRLFLLGHADGLALNEPYQVNNMQEAVNLLGANQDSPLIRAMLEAYNMGARDIWLMAAAPESEYVPFDPLDQTDRFVARTEWDGLNFYEKYFQRLEDTYEQLRQYDYPEIVVPVEAPFFFSTPLLADPPASIDFLGQLINHCADAYQEVGVPRIGVIGTRLGNFSDATIQDMINDTRLDIDYGSAGKFVMIAAGEAVFSMPQISVSHVAPVATAVAALIAKSPVDVGPTHKLLTNVQAPYGRQLTKDEIAALSARKVNHITRTARGKRGMTYQSMLATDNTMASDGSDFWSIVQMRLVSKVLQEIRSLGYRMLGTIGFLQFRAEVSDFLTSLVVSDQIRDFDLMIERDNVDMYKAVVDVTLLPFFGVREIFFSAVVGPGV